MKNRYQRGASVIGATVVAGVIAAGNVQGMDLTAGDFDVRLNPGFPGVIAYALGGESVELPSADPVFLINGGEERPSQVELRRISESEALYDVDFADLPLSLEARVVVGRQAMTLTLENIREPGDFLLRTIEIPGLVLLHARGDEQAAIGNFPAASYASENPEHHDMIGPVSDLAFVDNEEAPNRNRGTRGQRGASYTFVSNGSLAAGLFTNVIEEELRMVVELEGEGAEREFTAAPGMWTYREIPSEILPTPRVTLVVAKDENGDGVVCWQDAAIAYRREVPQPYAAETVRDFPVHHIAFNFAGQATYPFLRVLDNVKKIWLYTDGLGQRIQFKGYQSEGHDSSHPDYAYNVGRRMGGRDDLNFVMRRARDFNMYSGVHINAHEYHAEAKWFCPTLVDMNAVGWSWLDESFLTDYRHDSAYGTLYERLEAMRDDLPWLDFVYLDVYYGRGWPGWRMATKTNDLGIVQTTEFPGVMEQAVIWNHVANDWTQQIGGKGDRSEIARFIWYSHKDTFAHDPLLRGSNCDGFMGWHAERNMLQTVHSAININLPTKYLQHFELIRMEDEAAWFRGGPRTEVLEEGAVSRVYGRDGQLIHSLRYNEPNTRPVDNLAFIPWNPLTEEKIYHWNDEGGTTEWEVPSSWAGVEQAELYRLTDLGRVFERMVAVADGRVELADIEANTPYVLYRETPPALPEIEWGEGGLVADPGFNSYRFGDWRLVTPEGSAVHTTHPELGQTELIVPSDTAAEVRQTVTGLEPGVTYSASVWLSIEERREASLAVEAGPPQPPPFIDPEAWVVLSAPRHMGGDRARRILDGNPKTLWHSLEINEENDNPLPHEIVLMLDHEYELDGFVQTARENLGNGAIRGFEAYVSLDNENWTRVAEGEFDYGDGTVARVEFDAPVRARYFKLLALSEVQDRPFISIAGLNMLIDPEKHAPAPLAEPVMRSVEQTYFTNYTDQSAKYLRNWHRLRVLFEAPEDGRVDLVLRAAEGPGQVSFDDVRLVVSGRSEPPSGAENVVLFEDFENVDEGWGPFMYGWRGPMNTHLSETNEPYTNDTIGGEFSLKSRQERGPGMIYRTVPATLALEAGKKYTVSFDYLNDTEDCFAFVVGTESAEESEITHSEPITNSDWEVTRLTTTFIAGENAFIGITRPDPEKQGTIVIDNLLISE